MAKEKEAFAWDNTQEVGTVPVNDKKRVQVSFNELNDKWFVSLATEQFIQRKTKGETEPSWKVTKNATFPLDTWASIVELIEQNTEEVEE